MEYRVDRVQAEDHPRVIELWEASVRATHHFLSDEDIVQIRAELPGYFRGCEMFCIRDRSGVPVAFSGICGDKLEMLFADPAHFGTGLGKTLLNHSLECMRVRRLDVNEDNTGARRFYEAMGFRQVGRSATDSAGRQFPLIHMSRG